MSAADPKRLSDKEIDLTAAGWLVRIDDGLSAAEQDELMEWLAEDPRNGEWLTRHRLTWKSLDALVEWRPEHSGEPNPDLLARRFNPRLWVAPAIVLAAAAALAAAFILTGPATVGPRQALSEVASTYERRVLEDGSIIELKPGTAVTVAFSATARRVNLDRGEALFTVAKNHHVPFVVSAAGVDVLAVGTAFDVRLDARSVAVLVTEGRVKVGPPGQSLVTPVALQASAGEIAAHTESSASETFVGAGEGTVVALGQSADWPAVVAIAPKQMVRELAWQPSLLSFDSAPLVEVVAEFNRRNRTQIVIADPALESFPIVASIRSDNVDGFVRLLEQSGSVSVDRTDVTITLRRAR